MIKNHPSAQLERHAGSPSPEPTRKPWRPWRPGGFSPESSSNARTFEIDGLLVLGGLRAELGQGFPNHAGENEQFGDEDGGEHDDAGETRGAERARVVIRVD